MAVRTSRAVFVDCVEPPHVAITLKHERFVWFFELLDLLVLFGLGTPSTELKTVFGTEVGPDAREAREKARRRLPAG